MAGKAKPGRMRKAKALDFVKANPKMKWDELEEATGVPASTLRSWAKADGYTKPSGANPFTAAARAREGTPASDLPVSDREELVDTVRLTRQAIRHEIQSIRERQCSTSAIVTDDKQPPAIDKNTAVSLNALSGMMRNLLAAHPGLMAEVNKAEGGNKADRDKTAARLAERLGVDLPE